MNNQFGESKISRRKFLTKSSLSLTLASLVSLSTSCPTNNPANQVYITIDDGPGDYMEAILDLFAQTQDKATFFVLGLNCENEFGYSLITRALCEGHLVGNHSYSHPIFQDISKEEAQEQVNLTHEILAQAYSDSARYFKKLFRFPYGSEYHNQIISNLGYEVIRWDNDPRDYAIDEVNWTLDDAKNICSTIQPKDIILTHDLQIASREIIPYILQNYTSGIIK